MSEEREILMKEFLEDILAAKRQFDPIKMDKVNKGFNSKYASLTSVMTAIEKHLMAKGIRIQHTLKFNDSVQWLETILVHSSGHQTEASSYILYAISDTPTEHKKGIGISYAKRYTVSALLGLIVDEDDDGNAASGVSDKKTAPKPIARNLFQLLVEWAKLPDKVVKDELQKHNVKTIKELDDFTMEAAKAVINKYKENINE